MVTQQLLLVAATALALVANDTQFAGRWDATVVANGVEVPFEFEIIEEDSALKGSFFNGDERVTSTSSRLEDGRLVLRFDQYATRLDLALENGELAGEYQPRRARRLSVPRDAGRRSAHERRIARLRCAVDRRHLDRPGATATRASRPGASSRGNRAPRSTRRSCASTATPAR